MKRIVTITMLLAAQTAGAELSANLGWQSEYIFRGIPQSTSSAQGGVDFESGGFYLGTWAADVGVGAEIDGYGGYGWEVNGFSFGIGATGYFYTDDFDDTYRELNLSLGHSAVTLDFAAGEYDNFAGPTLDYTFLSASFEHGSGLYGVIGTFGADAEGDYYSVGYGTEVNGIDLSVDLIYSDNTLLGASGGESNLVFSIGKSFDLNR
ncbi:MAG: TorF family putative porin [Gammaproteobacteria bacterium]|nr:TorF family putative porin [Gammaproteobacteria bacterium]NNF60934.1 hypothetical protein [Gammaproteobacteria bacterium]NNM20849.1 hypothetical protein [Gammaproteobacteria bacterium]